MAKKDVPTPKFISHDERPAPAAPKKDVAVDDAQQLKEARIRQQKQEAAQKAQQAAQRAQDAAPKDRTAVGVSAPPKTAAGGPDPDMTFDRYFSITGRPSRHRDGMRVWLQRRGGSAGKKPLSYWKKVFATY